jgi:hypothetical protein
LFRVAGGAGNPQFLAFPTLSGYNSCLLGDRRRNWLSQNPSYRAKARGTRLKANSTAYAFLLVDDMDLILATYDRLYRAFPKANHAGLALIRVNIV